MLHFPFRKSIVNSKAALLSKLSVGVLALTLGSTAYCCSTFSLNDGDRVLSGRNMDFHVDGGLILLNPSGVTKVGFPTKIDMSGFKPVKWTSRYPSLTFSLFAREFPSSGINDQGLVVNEMTLRESVYPAEDGRPALVPLQWIQYQLDNCATIEEVLATDEVVRVSGWEAGDNRGHHFLVSDKSGKSVTIEFVNGKRIVHQGQSLSYPALTNSTYQESDNYLSKHERFGGDQPLQLGPESKDRFVGLADKLQRYELVKNEVDAVNYAFESLAYVAAGKSTVWSIVYDATNQQVYYRTLENPRIRTIDAKKLFDNAQEAKLISINNSDEGDLTDDLVPYTTAQNLDHVTQFMLKYSNREKLSNEQLLQVKGIAEYPKSFVQ